MGRVDGHPEQGGGRQHDVEAVRRVSSPDPRCHRSGIDFLDPLLPRPSCPLPPSLCPLRSHAFAPLPLFSLVHSLALIAIVTWAAQTELHVFAGGTVLE